jgi:hypothetical protein
MVIMADPIILPDVMGFIHNASRLELRELGNLGHVDIRPGALTLQLGW